MEGGHVITIDALGTGTIERLLERAEQFAHSDRDEFRHVLRGNVMAPLFYEPSTRTRCSFEIAARRLGMDVIYFDADVSSVTKGESLWDTLQTLEAMGVNVAVLRHPRNDVYATLPGKLEMRLVNAGNGTLAHPTQALVDWLTMRQTFGTLYGLTVAIVGDVRHSRVARSNIAGLVRLGANPIVSGPDVFRDAEVECVAPYVPFEEALRDADVVMMLRIQRERLEENLAWEMDDYLHQYGLTEKRLELLKSRAIMMHPRPVNRGIELDEAVIEHDRSRIRQQVANGVYVRMAVLEYVLGRGMDREAHDQAGEVLPLR